jgi:hypothetical protein
MPPTSTGQYGANLSAANVEHFGDSCLRKNTSSTKASNFSDLGFSKLGHRISLSGIVDNRSAFGDGVSDVIPMRSRLTVSRIHARRVIADVHEFHLWGKHYPSRQKPGNSVRPHRRDPNRVCSKLAVAALVQGSSPNPARPKLGAVFGDRTVFVNFDPKPGLHVAHIPMPNHDAFGLRLDHEPGAGGLWGLRRLSPCNQPTRI